MHGSSVTQLRRESRDPTEDWLVFQDYERTAGSDVEGSRSPDSYFHTTSQWLEPQSATSSSPSSSPSANSSASSASLRPEYQGSKASSSTARLEILDALEIPLEAPVAEKFSNLHAPTPCPPQPPRLRKGVVKAEVTLKIPGSYPWHAEVSPKATGPASPESDLEIDWDLLRRVLEETEAQRRALPPNASKPSKPEDKPTPAIVLTPTNIDKTITLKAKVPEPPKRRTSTCGICQEPFYISSDPLLASRSKSNEVFGLSFACPGTHKYCLECLTSYVRTKLDPDDETHGGEKFAVRCPECPRDEVWRMGDWTAVKLLDGELLEAWYFQRLLASLDYFSCPDPDCAAPIEEPSERLSSHLSEVVCPRCRVDICFRCRKLAHPGRTCNENAQSNTADRALYELAQRLHWRRCPRCKILVERTEGCRHMTCRCHYEFCHTCGSQWKSGCTRFGGCGGDWRDEDLWPEAAVVPKRSTQELRSLFRLPSRAKNVCPRPRLEPGLRQRLKDRLRLTFHTA